MDHHNHVHSLNEDIEKIMMPSIQPFNWEHKDKIICKPILNYGDAVGQQFPLLTIGMDKPEQFEPLQKTPNNEKFYELFHKAAMKNISSVEIPTQEFNAEDFKVIIVAGNYYAAEKIFDKEFMKEIQKKNGYDMLAVSLPRKGTMYMTNGILQPESLRKFMAFTEMKFREDEKTKPISKLIFIVQDGEISGIIQPKLLDKNNPKENSDKKKKSFWNKLFGK
jgi:hypothetical protein